MKRYDLLAVGELNPDLVFSSLGGLPRPGEETIAGGFAFTMGSSTAICACGVARLGLRTGFAGKVGDDVFGRKVLEELGRCGIDAAHVRVDPALRTGVTVSLSMENDRALVSYLGSIDKLTLADIDPALLGEARHIHVGSFFLQSSLRPGLPALFGAAREKGLTTSLDAGWDASGDWRYNLFEVLGSTDYFFPNESEALHITGESTPERAAAALARLCRCAVVKCGPAGAVAAAGGTVCRSPAFDVPKVDTTGAGDSFNAGFLYAVLCGKSLREALRYANACGSLSVARAGGAQACPDIGEVERLIRERSD